MTTFDWLVLSIPAALLVTLVVLIIRGLINGDLR